MKVLKFGGTSVGTAENLLNVKRIVEANNDSVIVVVSALGGVTDKLIETARLAEAGDVGFEKNMTEIIDRHLSIIVQVIPVGEDRDELTSRVSCLLSDLHQHYQDVFAIRTLSPQKLATIVSYGERVSSIIVTTLIEDARWFDSLLFIKTEYKHHKHRLVGKRTDQLIHENFHSIPKVSLVPGFISTDIETGEITNLGRGGSDYTAAILAAALDAECLEIWTDVDGFMTADPRLIQSAFPIKELSYNEAEELCNYGAKVVYPPTIYPVWYKNIPVLIKNTMNPDIPGTTIRQVVSSQIQAVRQRREHKNDNSVNQNQTDKQIGKFKGISSIKDCCLVTVSVGGKQSTTKLYRTIPQELSSEGIQILLSLTDPITNKLLLGIKKEDIDLACIVLKQKLSIVTGGQFQLAVTCQLSTIAIVGEQQKNALYTWNSLYDCLVQRGVHIVTPYFNTSELSTAFMVESKDLLSALRLIHGTIFTS